MNSLPLRLSLALCALAVPAAAEEPLVVSYGRLLTAPEAAATVAPETVAGPADWGISTPSILALSACGAVTRDAAHTYQIPNCARVEPITGGTQTTVGWDVHLPTGAQVLGGRLHYFDNIAGEPSVALVQNTATGTQNLIVNLTPGPFVGGNATFVTNLVTPHTVVNLGGGYAVAAILNRTGAGTLHGIYGVEIFYRLQVSPAPATATFPNDVPIAHPFFRFVEALAAAGISGGCAQGSFCPNDPVTRGQMAVFLSTALGLHFAN
jgi:hypothetical protein